MTFSQHTFMSCYSLFPHLLLGSEKFGSGFLCATFGHFCPVLLSDAECTYRPGCVINHTYDSKGFSSSGSSVCHCIVTQVILGIVSKPSLVKTRSCVAWL